MSMIRLTVEEMNLLSIYHEGSKAQSVLISKNFFIIIFF